MVICVISGNRGGWALVIGLEILFETRVSSGRHSVVPDRHQPVVLIIPNACIVYHTHPPIIVLF